MIVIQTDHFVNKTVTECFAHGIKGQKVNIKDYKFNNADTIATELAINLSASKLIFISDVPFIKDVQGERISAVDENIAKKLSEENIISDGMVVKVENSLKSEPYLVPYWNLS